MADHTHIEWTDATWNIITGCSVVSAGCKHCYAMKLAGTRLQHHPSRAGLTIETKAGPVWNGQVRFNEAWLDQPLRWRRPRRIFVCAHGDLFHESVPEAWLDKVFAVMAIANWHTFQVLTKRPERMRAYCTDGHTMHRIIRVLADAMETTTRAEVEHVPDGLSGFLLPNVWLGTSVEDQDTADERIPELLRTPAAVRWISAEPLLGSIDLTRIAPAGLRLPTEGGQAYIDSLSLRNEDRYYESTTRLDWVVAGGESGPGARAMHPAWARSLRDQCAAAGVPFLFKQWGAWAPVVYRDQHGARVVELASDRDRTVVCCDPLRPSSLINLQRMGKKAAGRILDGVSHDGYPEALR